MLVEKQKQLGLESVLKLKQDIRTRWNSTFLMLERLIKLKEPLTIVMITIREAPKQYPTLSTIIPLIRGLQSSLVSKTQTTRLGMYIKNKLIENTNRRFDSIEKQTITPNFSRATMLNPRCKKVAFGSEQNANETERYLVNETAALISNASNAAFLIENPPQIQITIEFPEYGIADNKFVITVAPQKDICPHGNTYPTKAVIIVNKSNKTPIIHVFLKLKEFI
ncbi:hypothetical protein QTP88_010245 [Uroleucon formosanum]